jgi:hypothetical protein
VRSEGGQASVEWVGALLLIAIALGALARLSDRVDAPGLATAGLRATKCAVAGCEGRQARVASTAGIDGSHSPVPASRAVTLPPLLPPPPPGRGTSGAPGNGTSGAPGSGAAAPRRPSIRFTNPIPPRMGARFGTFWRRAWVACFAYERVRYGLLHPENHRQVVPLRDVARMTNDCLSPFDLSRDWEHLRP